MSRRWRSAHRVWRGDGFPGVVRVLANKAPLVWFTPHAFGRLTACARLRLIELRGVVWVDGLSVYRTERRDFHFAQELARERRL